MHFSQISLENCKVEIMECANTVNMPSELKYLEHLTTNLDAIEELRDLTLIAGIDGAQFDVHRVVMMASSPYFKMLLGSKRPEMDQDEVILSDIDGATLKTIIQFCYSGHAQITCDTADDVMTAAIDMELNYLEEICLDFWNDKLAIDNCVTQLMFASKYDLIEMWNNSLFFICDKFEQIPIADMVELDEENFEAILKEDEIAADESTIFSRFVEWVQHDKAERAQYVATMTNSIRLQHMPTEFLMGVVVPFYEKNDCDRLVMDSIALYNNRLRDPKPISLHRMRTIYLADISDPGAIDVYKFDKRNLELDIFQAAFFKQSKNMFYSDGKLVVYDDASAGETTINLKSFDLISGDVLILPEQVWPVVPLTSISGPPVSIGNHIYVFGEIHSGSDDIISTNCACFNTKSKKWKLLKPLPYRMSQLSAVELNGMIYVAGNIDRSEDHSSNFWCYDPNRNVWNEKAHTNLDGHKLVLCKTKQTIFLCNHLVGLLKYDAAVNRWSKLKFDAPEGADRTDYQMTDAVDCGNDSYGILSSNRGHLFVNIKLNENECCVTDFMQYFLEDIEVVGANLHLFVR